jgi:branched-chain amino acid transport system permease protein
MLFRETGQFKTSYSADMAMLPLREDRVGIALVLVTAFLIVPFFGSQFFLSSVMIPFLVYSLVTMGLNIVTGYTGLISLGTAGFMGVGAYACFKLTTLFPEVNILIWVFVSGFFSAAIGALFGLPSLRIKGFYLAVATLAAQFFLEWCFVRIPWLYDYAASGAIAVPERTLFGIAITGANATPLARYFVILAIVAVMTLAAANLLKGRIGRNFMAIRDMDIAAELMGIRLLPTKLLAFAISSFYCGVAGAVLMFFWYGGGEASDAFNINQSFLILFMVIIGGLGSLLGCFLGAGLLHLTPIFLKFGLPALGIPIAGATAEHLNHIIVGLLIIFFLIVEPHGMARLWSILKQKLRIWPFPH